MGGGAGSGAGSGGGGGGGSGGIVSQSPTAAGGGVTDQTSRRVSVRGMRRGIVLATDYEGEKESGSAVGVDEHVSARAAGV